MSGHFDVEHYDWSTEGALDLLKRLWAEGFSASEIRNALPADKNRLRPSRSAVIGKVHRLKLDGRRPARPRRRPNNFARINAVRRQAKAAREQALAARLPPEPPPPPDMKRVALMELHSGMCRWPLGDPREPGFAFCGCPVTHVERHRGGIAVKEPAPYCPYHQRAAHESGAQAARRERREDAALLPRLRANGIKGHGQWSL